MWGPQGEEIIRAVAPQNFVYFPHTSFPPCSTPCWPRGGGAGAAWNRGPGRGSQGADAAAGRLRTQRQGLGQRRLPESRAPAPLQPRPARLPLCRRLLPCGKGEGEPHKPPQSFSSPGCCFHRNRHWGFFTWDEMEVQVQRGMEIEMGMEQERKGWDRMGMMWEGMGMEMAIGK